MADPAPQPDLLLSPPLPEGTMIVNERCLIRANDNLRVVVVAGVPLTHYVVGDRMAEAYAMVCLVEQGWADQKDVARALGYSERTLRRYQRRFEEGGLQALGRPRGYPKGRRRVPPSRVGLLRRLKSRGLSNCQIAHRLGITETAIRKLLKRLGWQRTRTVQADLPFPSGGSNPKLSASSDPPPPVATPDRSEAPADPKVSAFPLTGDLPVTFDTDPMNRVADRLFACLGLLDDAAPLFESRQRVPHAGLLLAVPAILSSGVLDCARKVYGAIGPAFYGLRTTMVTLLLMALLRIKRPEGLKERLPQDLGRVLGLDRAPEVKTVRRKLTRLAALGQATAFGRALAQCRVAERGRALGFLYVDGHVRVYHGKRVIPKAHVARMRLSMPATTDYWVNDREGEPLFVVTAEANAGLCRMLPEVLAEVRSLIGERRVTIVFDRGGWSPRLFQKLIADGFDLLTYRKGRFRKAARSRFQEQAAKVDGRTVRYCLADQGIALLGGALRLRQVTRLDPTTGHQTPIVTSRRDLSAVTVAYRMFERWRQENFFKYLREEYALDALVDYAAEPADPDRDVPNPAWGRLDAKGRRLLAEAGDFAAAYGLHAMINPETSRPTMRGFKIAHSATGRKVQHILRAYAKVKARRDATPRRVPVCRTTQEPIVKLDVERKHLTNVLKMVAYQAESDLVDLLTRHYRRAQQEGRTLVQSALASAADLEVTKEELRVRLAPMSSAHRTRAIAALCEELNGSSAAFPGTRLRLQFSIPEAPA